MKRSITYLFLCLSAAMCWAQQWHTTIDLRRPPVMPLDETVERVLIVNNSVSQPTDFGHHTIHGNEQNTYTIEIDVSEAPLYCLMGMYQVMQDADERYTVSVLEKTQNRTNRTLTRTPLTQERVDSLCQLYDADVIVELDQIVIYDLIESFLNTQDRYYAHLSVYQNTTWNIQYPRLANTSKHIDAKRYIQSDTLIWESTALTRETAINQLPERQKAILDMSMYVGENVAKRMLSSWHTVDRYYYENKDYRITLGLDAFTHYEFDTAIQYWTEAAQTTGKKKSKKQTRAYAAANLAALYEMLGDTDNAIAWAEKAKDSFLEIGTTDAEQQAANFYWYEQEIRNYKKTIDETEKSNR